MNSVRLDGRFLAPKALTTDISGVVSPRYPAEFYLEFGLLCWDDCPMSEEAAHEVPLIGGRSVVTRVGDAVFRQARPWSRSTIALLIHLHERGFEHAPRIIGNGFDVRGREMLTYVEGESIHPKPWDDSALPVLGEMLLKLHEASKSFSGFERRAWSPWFGRRIGTPSVVGHCDTGPWNIIHRERRPVALIDWEEAGPVDPMVELAQACWLNAQLFDDDIAEIQGLGSARSRAKQVKLLLDGYHLPKAARLGFVDLIRDFAILNAANEAIEAGVRPNSSDSTPAWGIAWRAKSAAWIIRNHKH